MSTIARPGAKGKTSKSTPKTAAGKTGDSASAGKALAGKSSVSKSVASKSVAAESSGVSSSSAPVWTTKYGLRRVRNEAPTLAEAIDAATCFAETPEAQAEVAAALMGVAVEEVRAEMSRMPARRPGVIKPAARSVAFTGPASAPRAIVVERKPSRRIVPAAGRTARLATLRPSRDIPARDMR